jgi:hypothetical protein
MRLVGIGGDCIVVVASEGLPPAPGPFVGNYEFVPTEVEVLESHSRSSIDLLTSLASQGCSGHTRAGAARGRRVLIRCGESNPAVT